MSDFESNQQPQLSVTPSPLPIKKWYQHKGILSVIVLFVIASAAVGSYFSFAQPQKQQPIIIHHKTPVSQAPFSTSMGSTQVLPTSTPTTQSVYFGKGDQGQYNLVNMDNGQSQSFIPKGYSILSQHGYIEFPTFLILQKDNSLFSYNVANGQIFNISALQLQANEQPNVEPSITEKDKFFIEIGTYPSGDTNEMGGPTAPTSARSYFYDATANKLSSPSKFDIQSISDCTQYDSLNQRFFDWPCGEGVGSAVPLSITDLQGKILKTVLSPQDFGLSDTDSASLQYNNGLFFGIGGKGNNDQIIILNPQPAEPTKAVYIIDPSVIAAQPSGTNAYLNTLFGPYSMALSYSDKTIIIGGEYSILLLHYNDNNEIYESKDLPDNPVYANFIFPYQGKLYYQSQNGTVNIINLDTWQVAKTITSPHNEEITLFTTPVSQNQSATSTDVLNLPQDKCTCWDGKNNQCLPQSACE